MTKQSPLPWKVDPIECNHGCYHSIRDANGVVIFSTWAAPNQANAVCVVDAVNAHDAAEEALKACKMMMLEEDLDERYPATFTRIKTALAMMGHPL